MKTCSFIIALLLFCSSCNNKAEVPEGILPTEKMEQILLDMVRADEIINRQIYVDSVYKTMGGRTRIYQDVFTKHKLTREQFQKSLNFYQNRPDLLKIVLDSMQSEVKRAEQKRTDSITRKLDKKAV